MLVNIVFPTTLRSMQPFLGILNYYSRFIKYFEVYASVLYELREADFLKINHMDDFDAIEGGRDSTLQGGDLDLNE